MTTNNFRKNFAILTSRWPVLAEEIKSIALFQNFLSHPPLEFQDRWSAFPESLLYVPGSLSRVRQQLKWQIDLGGNNIVIIEGGTGDILLEFWKKKKEDQLYVILFKTALNLAMFLAYHDLTDYLSNKSLILEIYNPERIGSFFRSLPLSNRYIYIRNPVSRTIPQTNELTRIVQKWVAEKNMDLKSKMSEKSVSLFHENIIRNSVNAFHSNHISVLFNSWESRPGVLVSAGPSLGKNAQLLKNYRNQLLICAVDAAIPYLSSIRICPTIVYSTHPAINHDRMLDQYYDFLKDSILCYDTVTNPVLVARFNGKRYFNNTVLQNDYYPLYRHLGDQPGLGTGYSVAHSAFQLLCKMGASPIILIGQDLAFGENLSRYALDIDYLENEKLYANPGKIPNIKVPGNNTEFVYTNKEFLSFINVFEEMIQAIDTPVINSTEGGAQIKGAIIKSLSETLSKFSKAITGEDMRMKFPFKDRDKQVISSCISAINELQSRPDSQYRSVLDEVQKYFGSLEDQEDTYSRFIQAALHHQTNLLQSLYTDTHQRIESQLFEGFIDYSEMRWKEAENKFSGLLEDSASEPAASFMITTIHSKLNQLYLQATTAINNGDIEYGRLFLSAIGFRSPDFKDTADLLTTTSPTNGKNSLSSAELLAQIRKEIKSLSKNQIPRNFNQLDLDNLLKFIKNAAPQDNRYYKILGYAYEKMKLYPIAIDYFTEYLKHQMNVRILKQIAVCYEKMGMQDLAQVIHEEIQSHFESS